VRTAIASACPAAKKRWPGRLEEVGVEHQLQVAGLGWLSCEVLRFENVAVDDQF
jgi:hypothetical protein